MARSKVKTEPRLYCVMNKKGKIALDPRREPAYFSSKDEAKLFRDLMNEDNPEQPWHVSPGPDHHKKTGHRPW